MSYGLTDMGFIKKPYEVIVEELESDYKKIFGDSINLAPESPQGQIIAITAEAIYDTWEMAEAVYGSFNIDNLNGLLLDSRAKLRGAVRLNGESDIDFKVRIKEQLPNSVFKLKDELHDNLLRVNGVEDVVIKYLQGVTKAFVVGGNDKEIANTILDYMPPGALYGNVDVAVDRCSAVKFFRPKFVPVSLSVVVGSFANLECECKAINTEEIKKTLLENSCGVGYGNYLYTDYIRNVLSKFVGLRVVSIEMKRADSVDSIDCNSTFEFGNSLDVVEVFEFEKIALCDNTISVVVQ